MNYAPPMLATTAPLERLVPLCEDDDYFEEQKVDGHRCLLHADDGNVRAVTRNGLDTIGMNPRVLDVFRPLSARWVFDGEYLQGVYHVFDIIMGGGVDFTETPYEERRDILEHFFASSGWNELAHVNLLPVARTHKEKCDLAALLLSQHAEGVVMKLRSATYVAGESVAWLRLKYRNTCDAFITSLNRGGHSNIVLSVYRDGEPVEIGECTANAGDGKHVTFAEGQVVEVTYQYASEAGKLVQPTLPRLRNDKTASECRWNQLVFGSKSVVSL